MTLALGTQILQALLFGAFFAALYYLVVGWAGWRPWVGAAVVLAGLAYIILSGAIHV